jgi:hypothetical protein
MQLEVAGFSHVVMHPPPQWYHLPGSDFKSHCCKDLKSDIYYLLLCLEGRGPFNFSSFFVMRNCG